ncbi:MAG: hypothetical protein NZ700_10795 [Gemmataceae bacterium]|nr:hypothetical protein [Gemmataceae bacterium]MDW8264206.1 hypothetical protein [Gemmataceae bacterium]
MAIPHFASVKDRVANGLQPFPGGFEWLQRHGFRTVLRLRLPEEDDSADRREVERLGLGFVSLEVSPTTLNRAVVDEFNRVVSDSAGLPLFVYDRDGLLAGGLWYLHFRLVDRLTDAEAMDRAIALGLKTDASEAHRTYWIAVQRLLSGARP